jgi:hypothetical protein
MVEYTDPGTGPVKPYGPPIREAIASGDAATMQAAMDNGTRWLAANGGDPAAEDVKIALTELDGALRRL